MPSSPPNLPSAAPPAARPAALGWRLLALVYDCLPVVAIWFLFSFFVVLAHDGPIRPWSPGFWLQNVALWALTGVYAVASWARGGQTLGMRPWRLRVIGAATPSATRSQLILRYLWSTVSLVAFGLGFAWSLVDPQRRSWHDRLSGTRMVRQPKA